LLSWEKPKRRLKKPRRRAEQKEKKVGNNTQNTWFFSHSSGKCGEAEVEKR